jgi:hypothetical protein
LGHILNDVLVLEENKKALLFQLIDELKYALRGLTAEEPTVILIIAAGALFKSHLTDLRLLRLALFPYKFLF